MTREPIEVTRQDRIYCLKASSDYHSEICDECRFYPNCDHMTQDDMTELTIKDLETLEQLDQEPKTGHWIRGHHGFGCSNCHKSIEGEWNDNIDDMTGTLFCPNCGAIMESEE